MGVLQVWGRARGWKAGALDCGERNESEEEVTAPVGMSLHLVPLALIPLVECWPDQAVLPETSAQRNGLGGAVADCW